MGMSQLHTPLTWQPEIGFHTRLREIRIQYGEIIGQNLTQDGFAKLLDGPDVKITASQLKQWEAGNSLPKQKFAVAYRVAEVTGVSAGWLLHGTSEDAHPAPPDGGGNIVPLAARKKVSTVQKSQYIYTARAA